MDGSQDCSSWTFGGGCTVLIRELVALQKKKLPSQTVALPSAPKPGTETIDLFLDGLKF